MVWDQSIQSYSTGWLGDWFVVWNNFSYQISSSAGFGTNSQMRIGTIGSPLGGPDRITYYATHQDVKAAADGTPAAPFNDYPIT